MDSFIIAPEEKVDSRQLTRTPCQLHNFINQLRILGLEPQNVVQNGYQVGDDPWLSFLQGEEAAQKAGAIDDVHRVAKLRDELVVHVNQSTEEQHHRLQRLELLRRELLRSRPGTLRNEKNARQPQGHLEMSQLFLQFRLAVGS